MAAIIGKKSSSIASQKGISGTVGKQIEAVYYIGIDTDTADTITDKQKRTIKVNVKKVPNTLTVIDRQDDILGTNTVFDGSENKTFALKNYTIGKINDKTYCLLKDGVQEGESITVPDGETIDTVTLVFTNDIPYLQFTFKNSSREPLLCSLAGLGIAEIEADIAQIKQDIGLINSTLTLLTNRIQAEEEARAQADGNLQGQINTLSGKVSDIEDVIPSQASAQNQLADKEFVNSSIATNTANFKGTYNIITDLGLTRDATHAEVSAALATKMQELQIIVSNNDYCFVSIPDAEVPTQIQQFDRYKFSTPEESGIYEAQWVFEYTLNNSSFTASQWAAINSGITSGKVTNYDNHVLDKNNPHEVTKAQVGLGNVDNTSDLNKPISTATQEALDLKADKSTTYTKAEVNSLFAEHDIHFLGSFESFDDLLEEEATVNDFACVTFSDGEFEYFDLYVFTLDNDWENILSFNIPRSFEPITDYEEELPEVDESNKNKVARLDGESLWYPEYRESPAQELNIYSVFTSNNTSITWEEINNSFTVPETCPLSFGFDDVSATYSTKYTIGNEVYTPIRVGTSKNSGNLCFSLNYEKSGSEKLYLVLTNYFSYNGAQGTFNTSETTLSVTINDNTAGGIAFSQNISLNFTASDERPEETLIDISNLELSHDLYVMINPYSGANRFFFNGFKIIGEDESIKEWRQLATVNYVDSEIETVEQHIDDVEARITEDETSIQQNTQAISGLDGRVYLIETEMGTVQVFDAEELPVAGKDYLNKILRVDKKLYQCVAEGDEDAFIKHFSFENVTGSNEVFDYNWSDFSRQITDDFDNYWTAYGYETITASEENPYHPVDGGTYSCEYNFSTLWSDFNDSDPTCVTINSITPHNYLEDKSTISDTPLNQIDYVSPEADYRYRFSIIAESTYNYSEAYNYLISIGIDAGLAESTLNNAINNSPSFLLFDYYDMDEYSTNAQTICDTLTNFGFTTTIYAYPAIRIEFDDVLNENTYETIVASDTLDNTSVEINFTFNTLDPNFSFVSNVGTYKYYKYAWASEKVFRENGSCKLGNNSTIGNLHIYRIDDSTLPITRVDVKVKSWSESKASDVYLTVEDDNNNYEVEKLIQASPDYQIVSIQNISLSSNPYINIQSQKIQIEGTDQWTDPRVHIYEIVVYYGQVTYKWVEVSGGAKVEIVDELPEQGEENTIYLIEITEHEGGGGGGSIEFEEVDELPEVGDPGVVYLMDPEGTPSNPVEISESVDYVTVAPTSPNTVGLKFAVLSEEPATKYDGWIYIITEE